MHEFSICKGIVDAVLSEYEKIDPKPVRLRAVRIIVGKLHQIVPETLSMAYDVLVKDTDAEGSIIEIKFIDVSCRCDNCHWEGAIDFPVFICKNCGTGNVSLLHGKELYLENLEVEYI